MMLRCIIVDDEIGAIDILSDYCNKANLEIVTTFRNSIEALNYLTNHQVDLVFLDIDMPNLNGMQFSDLIKSQKMMVIFCTAYSEYAVESYEREAIDYLLKPISFDRFLKAVVKAKRMRENVTKVQSALGDESQSKIFIKSGSKIHQLDTKKLLYMEKDGHYIIFHTTTDKLLSRMNMNELINSLPADRYARIHKSYVVAIDKIDTIERHFVTIKGIELPIGDSYKEEFFKKIEYSGN